MFFRGGCYLCLEQTVQGTGGFKLCRSFGFNLGKSKNSKFPSFAFKGGGLVSL